MTILSNRTFGGEVPRIPPDKLPADKAQQAVNCDFAYGELRPTKAGFPLTTVAGTIKSLFSVDGLRYASWPYKTKAWKGPVINDLYDRFYYTSQNGGLRVARTSELTGNGGEPSPSYAAGVPSVTQPLSYTFVKRSVLPDFPHADVRIYSYYEDGGKRYDERLVSDYAVAVEFKEWTFTVAEPTSTLVVADDLSTGSRGIRLAELVYTVIQSGMDSETYTTTIVPLNDDIATIIDSTTVEVAGNTYSNVTSLTPSAGAPTAPGVLLEQKVEQAGAAVPNTARLSVRMDVIDTVKNSVMVSLSASSGVAPSRSDAVPGGVEAALVKNGTAPGAWKLVLTYGVIETRSYVVTMINQAGEESKPSSPLIVSPTYLDEVHITFTPPSFTGYIPGDRYRVYRSVNNEYLSCTASPVSYPGTTDAQTFVDDQIVIKNTDATLDTVGWDLPPSGLKGLTLLPNGFFAAFSGDTLYFSEPYAPWAWPYAMSFPVNLVGMRSIENSLVVTTVTTPYMVSGVHPDAMTQAALSASQAGISDFGMCVVGNSVAYISNDGLAVVRGFDVDLTISQQLWTREVWRQKFGTMLPDMELAFHDGAIVCSSPSGGLLWELRLDSEGGGNLSVLDVGGGVSAMYVLPFTDQLYYVSGTQLLQYKSGASAQYNWWGRDSILSRPINFGAGYINTSGTVTLTIYADGVQWHKQTFTEPGYFRIPSGRKALRWSYRLTGTGVVKELSLAETMQELRNV